MASVGFAFSRFLRCFIDYKGLIGFASLIFYGGVGVPIFSPPVVSVAQIC
jgi:hypothetical protein